MRFLLIAMMGLMLWTSATYADDSLVPYIACTEALKAGHWGTDGFTFFRGAAYWDGTATPGKVIVLSGENAGRPGFYVYTAKGVEFYPYNTKKVPQAGVQLKFSIPDQTPGEIYINYNPSYTSYIGEGWIAIKSNPFDKPKTIETPASIGTVLGDDSRELLIKQIKTGISQLTYHFDWYQKPFKEAASRGVIKKTANGEYAIPPKSRRFIDWLKDQVSNFPPTFPLKKQDLKEYNDVLTVCGGIPEIRTSPEFAKARIALDARPAEPTVQKLKDNPAK